MVCHCHRASLPDTMAPAVLGRASSSVAVFYALLLGCDVPTATMSLGGGNFSAPVISRERLSGSETLPG